MKKKYLLVSALGLLLCNSSCINSFLDIESKNLQTEKSAFQTYDNFVTYSWGFYSIFPQAIDVLRSEGNLPWLTNNTQTNATVWAYQKVTESTGNDNWNFEYIRRANLMLDNIDKSQLKEKEKGHWRSVGLFFRSYRYFELMSKYGDIPWAEHVVSEQDENIIYGKREKRDVVAANILRDLQYAEQNINPDGDGTNTINLDVVRALISRFGLFEGTWRKYHGLGNAETYLNACVAASEKLMQSNPELNPSYDELMNTENLTGMKGVLLFYAYELNILQHQLNRNIRASSYTYELSKDVIDFYLCSDGKPIGSSPLYCGDKTPYEEFRNRDRRLLYTVVPPSRVFKGGTPTSLEWRFLNVGETVKIGTTTITVSKEDSIRFREYIDLFAKISKPDQKSLPLIAWNNTLATNYTPRFRNFPEGISPFSGQHGYWYYRPYNTNPPSQASCSQDMPIFRMGEVLLNYAEAKYELGQFDQNVADQTINKLRIRGEVAPMKVSEVNTSFDPKRDQTVSPLLWEIRRERNIELIGEAFSFNDIRRWKKGEYFNIQKKGCWVKNAEFNNTLKIEGYASVAASKDKEGYVIYLDKPKDWLDHYYLYPIPLKDLVLNPQLEQNPGYKTPQ